MRTNFSPAQLEDPGLREAESILRKCVHCGFCTATCPTYVLLGDELDSPRGRIYQIQDVFENDRPADAEFTKHIDRCLSCLSCMTTCPSGVDYVRLIDLARIHVDKTHDRPFADRMLRNLLAWLLPKPGLFRLALVGAWLAKPLAPLFSGRMRAMLNLAPKKIFGPSQVDKPQVFKADTQKVKRVAMLNGCAQQVLDTAINEATVRLLTRHNVEVAVAEGAGCCGALTLHMGKEEAALQTARANIDAWTREIDGAGLDAVVINASGCGTTVKDYGHMLAQDPVYAEKAARIAAMTRDVTELVDEVGLEASVASDNLKVAYHSACSMQHGQRITDLPKTLLRQAGFSVLDVPESHLCCGSAGTYNILQPEIADKLKVRKVGNIESTAPDIIAAGNIGCMAQIGSGTDIPIVHTVELLDWATGGPKPEKLAGRA